MPTTGPATPGTTTPHDAHRRRTVALADGTRVAVVDEGEGDPVVLVHGIFLTGQLWAPVVDALAPDRRCIVPDLLGHGGTVAGPGTAFTMHSQADLVLEVCDALGIDRFDLVGNDSGGGIAQVVAATRPDRVRSLTLTNCDTHDNWPPPALEPIVDLARAGRTGEVLASLVADPDLNRQIGVGVSFEDPAAVPDEVLSGYLRPIAEDPTNAAILEAFLVSMDCDELVRHEADLRALPAPALIVWGTADEFFGIEWAHWLADALPGARPVVAVEGAELFFPAERPEALLGPLRELLAERP